MILASALRGLYHVSLLREYCLWLKVISDWTVASYWLTYVVQLNKRMSVLLKEQQFLYCPPHEAPAQLSIQKKKNLHFCITVKKEHVAPGMLDSILLQR